MSKSWKSKRYLMLIKMRSNGWMLSTDNITWWFQQVSRVLQWQYQPSSSILIAISQKQMIIITIFDSPALCIFSEFLSICCWPSRADPGGARTWISNKTMKYFSFIHSFISFMYLPPMVSQSHLNVTWRLCKCDVCVPDIVSLHSTSLHIISL